MKALEREIDGLLVLPPAVKTAFLQAWEYWTVPKDHYLVREQEICDYIFFIKRGIARIYYYKNGKEVTEWIAMDEQFFLSIISFFERKPSNLIIQTVEPAEVYGIHHKELFRLASEYHEVETLFRKMMTWSLILSQHRMDSIQFETAQQRYNRLIQSSPGITNRVPLSYIASFLGITLETLSRIRSASASAKQKKA